MKTLPIYLAIIFCAVFVLSTRAQAQTEFAPQAGAAGLYAAGSDKIDSDRAPVSTPDDLIFKAERASRPAAGLVINASFDTSITSNPNSAAIQAMINRTIAVYQAQFSDPVTINILFR